MLRALLGAVIGAGVALGVLYGWQLLGHAIFPSLSGIGPTDASKRAIVVAGSFPAQAWVISGYAVSVLAGGLAGNFIADARWPAMTTALLVVGAYFATLTSAPHPLWMQVTGVVLPVLAGLTVAARFGHRTMDDL